MQPGVDIWYMTENTENMVAQFPKKLHSTLQLVDTKVAQEPPIKKGRGNPP